MRGLTARSPWTSVEREPSSSGDAAGGSAAESDLVETGSSVTLGSGTGGRELERAGFFFSAVPSADTVSTLPEPGCLGASADASTPDATWAQTLAWARVHL